MENRSAIFKGHRIVMKKFILIISLVVLIATFTFIFASRQQDLNTNISNSHNVVQKVYEVHTASSDAEMFRKTTKALHEGWASLREGDSYKRAGRYEKAIEAYRLAYETDPGNRLMSGPCVIETYAKLFQFDAALKIVEDIVVKQHLAKYGQEQYRLLRTRLIRAEMEVNQGMTQQLLQSHEYFKNGQYNMAELGYISIESSLNNVESKAIIYDCLLDLYTAMGDNAKTIKACDWLIEFGNTRDKIRGEAVKNRLIPGSAPNSL